MIRFDSRFKKDRKTIHDSNLDSITMVARAEKVFEIQHITNKEKLKIAFINMEGGANHWFNFWK